MSSSIAYSISENLHSTKERATTS